MNTIKLALVDDDQLVVQLLSDLFSIQNDFEVLITANGGKAFLETLHQKKEAIDIVVLDLKMRDGDGIFTIGELKKEFPKLKVVVLSSHAGKQFTGHMIKLGVNAFLPKELDKEELLAILKEVHLKGHYFSNDQIEVLRQQVKTTLPQPAIDPRDELNRRELEVLELICQQYTAKEIAERLFISTKAVESRKSNLLFKLNVKNTAGLIIAAIQHGLVDPKSILLEN